MKATLFEKYSVLFKALTFIFVIATVLLHLTISEEYWWYLALLFSAVMNLVYPIQAFQKNRSFGKEIHIAATLILISISGVLWYPPLLIGAIGFHGIWDWCKHKGLGVSFPRWYPPICAIYDFAYCFFMLSFWL